MRSSAMPLVVRRKEGSLRRYRYIGTGNYNHKTARPGPADARPCRRPGSHTPVQAAVRVRAQVGVPPPAQHPPRLHRTRREETAAGEGSRRGSKPSATRSSMRSASTPCTAPARPARASTASYGTPQPQARYPRHQRHHPRPLDPVPFPRAFARLRLRQLAEPQTGEGRSPARKSGSGRPTSFTAIPTTAPKRSCTSPTRTRSSGFSTTSTCRCMTGPASGMSSPTAPASTTTTREAAVSTTANTSPCRRASTPAAPDGRT